MKSLCYLNGEIKPANEGAIAISDLGLQRSYAVFDYGRTYNGKLFHFDENIARLKRSASELYLELPLSDAEILEISSALIEQCDLETPAIRMILTGGNSSGLDQPEIIIIAEELPAYPSEVYGEGAKVALVEYQRELPHIKTTNYLNAIRLEHMMRERDVFDLLYHSNAGITECPRNNFFAFIGDTLITPSEYVLHGVTRKIVLKLADGRFPIEERKIGLEEIERIDEAFTTSTSKRVLPITRIDDVKIGGGTVGDHTKTIMRLFDEYTAGF